MLQRRLSETSVDEDAHRLLVETFKAIFGSGCAPRHCSVNHSDRRGLTAVIQDSPDDEKRFFCGIDWGGRFHHLCILDASGEQLLSRKIAHTVDGLMALLEVIASLGGSVRIAIERAEGLLVEHLQQHCVAEIYCVSPKISRGGRAVPEGSANS